MKVYFAIKQESYESDTVFGPFAKRKTVADFIEKDEDNSERSPWWIDDWSIIEQEVTDDWDKAKHLCYSVGKPYRPRYCEEQRRVRYEQRRKENLEKAAYEDQWMGNFVRLAKERMEPINILDNLKFGQEIEINLGDRKIDASQNA